MESNKKLETTNKVLRIIYYVLYALLTIFIIYVLVDSKIKDSPSNNIGYAFAFVIIGIAIGGISYGVLLILGLVDLIISAVNKTNPKRKKSVLISSISIILPIITYILIILIGLSAT